MHKKFETYIFEKNANFGRILEKSVSSEDFVNGRWSPILFFLISFLQSIIMGKCVFDKKHYQGLRHLLLAVLEQRTTRLVRICYIFVAT